jgi:hypothetical protein
MAIATAARPINRNDIGTRGSFLPMYSMLLVPRVLSDSVAGTFDDGSGFIVGMVVVNE